MTTDALPHILLVEDDLPLAEWIADYLIARDFRVTTTGRGDEAVEVIGMTGKSNDGDFDIWWTDNQDIDGCEKKALLINIEPIKQETCADLLAEAVELEIPIVSQDEDINKLRKINLWRKRAKAALERENEQD